MSEADFTGRTFGGFKIQRKLGAGGMAVVYQAHEAALNRTVALKVIHEHLSKEAEFVARFHREARAAAQLSHPNIVQIYTVGEENGVPYFAMEYVKGKSLQGLIQTDGFLTAPRAAAILEEACEALSAAHEAGIVHRDIKPSNIMLDGAGRVKVADFGIAHMASETRLTQTGMMLGTPGYTSPEQCFGAPLDARSDIYALGITAYEMLTGQLPFQADTLGSLIRQIIEGTVPPIATANPTVPPALRDIVEKMMHKNPEERFQNADDVVAALTRSDIDTRPVITQPSPRVSPPAATHGTAPTTARVRPADEPTRVHATNAPSSLPRAPTDAPPSRVKRFLPAIIIAPVGLVAAVTAVFFALRIFGIGGVPAPRDDAQAVLEQSSVVEQPEQTASDAAPVAVDADIAPAGAADAPPPSDATLVATPANIPATFAAPAPADPPSADDGASTSAATEPTATANAAPPRETEPQVESASSAGSSSRPAPTAAPAPPPRTVIASAVGDYENVDLVGAQVDVALARGGFEILDLVPTNRDVREVARFEIVSTVKLVGSRELSFANRRMTQYTLAVTVQATDLVSGTRAAGPFSTTVEYTSINLQEQLQAGVDELAADLIQGLEARLDSTSR